MSSDYFIVPTSPNYFCLQSIGSLRKHIIKWHKDIKRFKEDNAFDSTFPIKNAPKFLGAIQQRYRPRHEKPATSFQLWIDKIRHEIVGTLVPSLATIGCTIDENEFRKVLGGTNLEPFDLAHVPDFNSLIVISQQLSKPIFALTDQEVKTTGKLFGYAETTLLENRDNFYDIFDSLAKRIKSLTQP